MKLYEFEECVNYCGFDNLPEGLDQYYMLYQPTEEKHLIDRRFLKDTLERFSVPAQQSKLLLSGVEEIEGDVTLFHFTKFIVWDMCSARNRCDTDNYNSLTPSCLSHSKELYSFLLLLACVQPSMEMLRKRGVLEEYYLDIPYRPMKNQFAKLVQNDDTKVSDFPWDMNFYTCSIFQMDRFLFIPYKFGDSFQMFRNRTTNQVIALRDGGEEFRRDGQVNGINDVFDESGKFISIWKEDDSFLTANLINPMGFVERDPITIKKSEWEIALKQGDTLLALHVPAGPGYNPERLKNSMELAVEFYTKYFPELSIQGFWSESWLYDSRLSLILDNDTSNIIKVQRQFYLYPIQEGDGMLRYEAFGDWKADPEKVELKSSLQKAAAAYMKTGARFNTMSMIVLKEDVNRVIQNTYITKEDIDKFMAVVDSHLE